MTPSVRFREPTRNGITVSIELNEESLDPQHPARVVWDLLGHLDLTAFHAPYKAVRGRQGRRPNSPRLMVALWLYALISGVVHAREISRRIQYDLAFRWLAGDIPNVEHGILSEYLTLHSSAFESLLSQWVRLAEQKGLLDRFGGLAAQDGVRLQANASKDSFTTQAKLLLLLEQATLQLKAVRAQSDDPPFRP